MKQFLKPLIAGGLALTALSAGAAWAKPDRHPDSSISFSIRISDNDYDRHDRYRDRHDYGRRNGYRGRDGRIVNREVYDTRYRARIVLTEEVVRTRRGPRLICTVAARGPQARYVPDRRLRKIARRECSRRAEVRIYT